MHDAPSHASPMPGMADAQAPVSPEAVRLLALAACANGRLDVAMLSVLLELLARQSWLIGFRQALGQTASWAPPTVAPCGLTPREMEVLRLVAIGSNNLEIGRVLGISRNTVACHLRSILGKTFTANRTEAAAFAYREGLLAHAGNAASGPLSASGGLAARPTVWRRANAASWVPAHPAD